MTMTPRLRKLALTTHITSSVGFLGSVVTFLVLAIAGLTGSDARMVQAVYLAMESTAWFVIVPMCSASLLTGIIQSLGTPWGLFRHYWVVVKLLLTALAGVVLLLQMEGIGYVAEMARESALSNAALLDLRISLCLHAAGGVVVLLATTILSVYKPGGMTRYGWRAQYQSRAPSLP